ncbi:uncharacterized protein LOC132946719 [Metopolophium dirhodum]|uniref:uncharacterized protein LOC132946719 n=1 Tax=Metopolophium dirhodum TaxID=44670 RepID=UPI00298FFFF0|nr:uncharacterized protein LOC132946719 [Metopolophium dirhodum]
MSESVNLELMITIIEERPVIWDITLDIYKDRNLTRNAWKEICLAFVEDFDDKSEKYKDDIRKMYLNKWSNIRDNWVRSYKQFKSNERSGSGANKSKKYIFHEQLRFLEKVVDQRPTISSLAKKNDNSEEDNDRSIINECCYAIENENTAEATVSKSPRKSLKSSDQKKN